MNQLIRRRELITGALASAAYMRLAQAQSITPQIGGGISRGFDGGVSGGGAAVPITAKLVEDGDSITVGVGVTSPSNNWTARLLIAFPQFSGTNVAVSGQTMATCLANETTTVLSKFNAALIPNVVTIWAGTNDVRASTAAATIYANLQTYTANAKTAGFKVIWATMLPSTDIVSASAKLALMLAYNALIRGATLGLSNTADAIADEQSDNRLGQFGSCYDNNLYCNTTPTDFSQGIHPTDTAQPFVTSFWTDAMKVLLGPAQGTLLIDENFATGVYSPGPVTSDLVDTRATAQYVTSSAGVLSSIAANTLALSDVALFSEPAGQNTCLQSQAPNTTPWTRNVATAANNVAAAPDGTTTAASLIPTVGSGFPFAAQTINLAASTLYTASVWAKPAGWNFLRLSAGPSFQAFNISTGAVGIPGGTTGPLVSTIKAYANGWYRCSFSFWNSTTSSAPMVLFPQSADGSSSQTGDGVNGVLVWGAQHEAAGGPSSYMPTTTLAFNRVANSIQVQRTGIGRIKFTFTDGSVQTLLTDPAQQYVIPTKYLSTLARLQGYAT